MASKAVFFTAVFGLLACAAGMVVISAGDMPSPVNQCSQGPSHWCQSIANAKSCHATRHCIQTVWERQVVPEDNDSICEVCKEMVQEARDQLLSNETQEDMKQVFEGSCKLMPIKMVQLKCIKLVDDFIPELIEMLASQMNPTMVCTTALLCNNAWVDGLLSEYKSAQKAKTVEQLSNDGKCESCRAFMSHNAMKVQSSSQVDLQNILFNICSQMNSYSDACMTLVSQNIEQIFSALEQSLQKDACQPLGFCDESQSKPIRVSVRPLSNDRKFESRFEKSPKMNDDLECQFCEALVKNVRAMLISNTTEAEFIQVLNGLCKQTGTFAKECQALVEQYGDVAYTFFLKELDPQETCRLLTLCSSSIGTRKLSKIPSSFLRIQPEDIEATKLIPAQNDFLVGQDESNAIHTNNLAGLQALPAERLLPASISVLGPRKPGCMLCEYVLHEIVDDLKNVTVKEEIENVVKNICKKLPSSISKECDNLINTYGDAIFFLLSQELDPNILCTQLQLCTESVVEDIKLPANPFKAPTYGDANTCSLCEFVITMLDSKLEDNRTEESIKTALEGVCQRLPKTVRNDCVRLVDAYSKEIIEMLLADLKPDEVCVALKLCAPKTTSETVAVKIGEAPKGITVGEFLDKIKQDVPAEAKQIESTNTPQCVMCEYAMSILEKRLLTNSTEEEITRAIQFLCAHLPSTVADMCIDFVEQYGDELFELLTSEIAPKAVCTQMGLCWGVDKSHKLLGHKNEKETALEVTGWKLPSKCEICEIVIEYLDKLLSDDTIEASIDHIIEKACTVVPRGAQDKCTGIVDTYGPYLLSQLANLLDKKQVCQSVHLCKPPPGQVQLLGGKQCTWGPTYWCASPQHADACNALEHCQTKVWMKSQP
jgi:saposin